MMDTCLCPDFASHRATVSFAVSERDPADRNRLALQARRVAGELPGLSRDAAQALVDDTPGMWIRFVEGGRQGVSIEFGFGCG